MIGPDLELLLVFQEEGFLPHFFLVSRLALERLFCPRKHLLHLTAWASEPAHIACVHAYARACMHESACAYASKGAENALEITRGRQGGQTNDG